MIENIQYKFADNKELAEMSQSFMETYIYTNETDNIEADVNSKNQIDSGQLMGFNI